MKRIGGQTRHHQCGEYGGRAGHGSYLAADSQRFAHQGKARVGDAGHPRLRYQRSIFPLLQPLNEPLELARPGELVKARDRRHDAVMAEQRARRPGVFSHDESDRIQDADRPQRDILQISDGCSNNVERGQVRLRSFRPAGGG